MGSTAPENRLKFIRRAEAILEKARKRHEDMKVKIAEFPDSLEAQYAQRIQQGNAGMQSFMSDIDSLVAEFGEDLISPMVSGPWKIKIQALIWVPAEGDMFDPSTNESIIKSEGEIINAMELWISNQKLLAGVEQLENLIVNYIAHAKTLAHRPVTQETLAVSQMGLYLAPLVQKGGNVKILKETLKANIENLVKWDERALKTRVSEPSPEDFRKNLDASKQLLAIFAGINEECSNHARLPKQSPLIQNFIDAIRSLFENIFTIKANPEMIAKNVQNLQSKFLGFSGHKKSRGFIEAENKMAARANSKHLEQIKEILEGMTSFEKKKALEDSELRKNLIKAFNYNPKKAMELIEETPSNIAKFLRRTSDLDERKIAEYISAKGNEKVLQAYLKSDTTKPQKYIATLPTRGKR